MEWLKISTWKASSLHMHAVRTCHYVGYQKGDSLEDVDLEELEQLYDLAFSQDHVFEIVIPSSTA